MKEKQKISFKLNSATLVLIPTAVAINFIGSFIASSLKLPLWLDSIGTILAAFLGGPIAGALAGIINNIISGFRDPIIFIYAITNGCIGIVAGLLIMKAKKLNIKWAFMVGVIIAAVAILISTPLNIMIWGGQTGNIFGDAVFAWAQLAGMPLPIASLLNEIVVDLPDKIVVVLIVYSIYKNIPENLKLLYRNDTKIEELD